MSRIRRRLRPRVCPDRHQRGTPWRSTCCSSTTDAPGRSAPGLDTGRCSSRPGRLRSPPRFRGPRGRWTTSYATRSEPCAPKSTGRPTLSTRFLLTSTAQPSPVRPSRRVASTESLVDPDCTAQLIATTSSANMLTKSPTRPGKKRVSGVRSSAKPSTGSSTSPDLFDARTGRSPKVVSLVPSSPCTR